METGNPDIMVTAVNLTDPDYIMVYGPFADTDSAYKWIDGRADHGRFHYSAHPLSIPE